MWLKYTGSYCYTILMKKQHSKNTLLANFSRLEPFSYLLFLVFAIIFFLRFWKVVDLFNFTFSEEMQAVMAWEQVKNFHPIWIGVSAANINYYLGPGFTYLNAALFYFSQGDPAVLAYFSSLLGFATSISIYYITSKLFDRRTALFATIIYGCSTLINFHDRRFWNPTPIPLITVWFVYSLIKARENTQWYILTAALIGATFHTHLSLLLLLVPAFYSVVLNFKKIKPLTWILAIACYLAITSPLIIFDMNHNYDNLLMPYRTITGQKKADLNTLNVSNSFTHVKEIFSAMGRLWFIKLYTNPQDEVVLESHMDRTQGNFILSLLSVIALGWFYFKNRKKGWDILFIAISTILVMFILYPSYNPEYYLLSFLTLLTIAIGYWLAAVPKNISLMIVGIFIIANVFTIITASDKYGLTVRKKLVKETMPALKDQSFSLETAGPFINPQFAYAGWRYLFKVYGKTPSQSNVDSVLSWIYPDEVAAEKPKLKVIVYDTQEPELKEKPLAIIHSGPYHAYVFANK